jgi:hypothetical protein
MDQSAVNAMLAEVARFKRANPAVRKYLMMGTGRGEEVEVKTAKLMDPLKDLGGIELYKLFREQVSTRYGVTLPFMGIPTPGRLGNEQQQIEVSYDTIAEEQAQVEEFFAAFVRARFPEVTDWHLELVHPQKDDLRKKAEIQKTVAETAAALQGAGFQVDITDEWEVRITGKAAAQPPQQPSYPPPPPSSSGVPAAAATAEEAGPVARSFRGRRDVRPTA